MTFKSIKTHFSFYIIILFVLFSFALLAISYVSAENIRETLAIRYSNMYSESVKNRISNMVKKNISASLQMSRNPVALNWLKPGNEISGKAFFFKNIKNIQNHLAKNIDVFVCRNDNYHYYFNYKYIESLSPSKSKDIWYFKTIKKMPLYDLNIDPNPTLNAIKLWINVPVLKNGKVLGIIGIGENIGLFLDKVLKTNERGTSIVLIDQKGIIKAHKNRSFVEKINFFNLASNSDARVKIAKVVNDLKSGAIQTGSLYIELDNEKYYAAIKYIKSIGWYQIFLVKTKELISLSHFFPLLAASILSFILFLILVLIITNKIIITPIALLTKNVEQVSSGNFDIENRITSKDELGMLEKTFNNMAITIKDYTENLEEKIRIRTCELKNKNKLILDSINYAKRLQNSILPDDELLNASFKKHFIYWNPKDIVGGDFYWLKPQDNNNFIFAVADCTGHGVPGALMAMLAATTLSAIVSNNKNYTPSAILTQLDKELRSALKQDKEKAFSNDGLEIGLCLCKPDENKIVYAGSKMMLIKSSGGKTVIFKGDKSKIGYKQTSRTAPFKINDHEIDAEPESTFYLSTDGYYDQNGLNSEYPFGKNKFEDMIKSFYNISLDKQLELIDKNLKAFMGDSPQRDDITVAGFKL